MDKIKCLLHQLFVGFNKFKCGLISTEDALHARRTKTATSVKMVAQVKEIVNTDARYTTRQIASIVGISLGAAHTILKRDLKMRKICARWIPHLPTDEQKKARLQCAKLLLKQSFCFQS